MTTTDSPRLHPLHALYVGRSHGEASTLALRVREGTSGSAKTDGATAALLTGLGLAVAAVAVCHLAGKVTGGK